MKVTSFKKRLKKAGIDYSLVNRKFNRTFSGYDSLEELIASSRSYYNVFFHGFNWGVTKEGYNYWESVAEGATLEDIKKTRIFKHEVKKTSKGGLKIGCASFSKKELEEVFKELADHLGYEILT